MSGYKKNASSNRDALFGGASSGTSRPAAAAAGAASKPTTKATSMGYTPSSSASAKKSAVPIMSAEARAAKVKEAEEYREKANNCMKTGFFKKPDPGAACIYFKRAADAYHQLGEWRLERLFRIESGECNMQCGAWASAASDFTRAAELMLDASDVADDDVRRRDASTFHKKAATAWTEMNEKAKAAASQVAAAIALHHGVESAHLSKEAITGMEEAVEAHVPDPLNPYARYRQTGTSAFIDPDSDETAETCSRETLEMAKGHLVTRAYAHEPLQELVHLLTSYGEYASALYAAGAVSTVLASDGLSTLSLSRAYVVETILTLAMGDPVAAEQQFLNRHCQDTFYLKSRECQLAEELFRAVKTRDMDALETARSVTGPNRSALANLPSDTLRATVQELRVSGVARKKAPGEAVAALPNSSNDSKKLSKTGDSASAPPKEEVPLQDLLRQKTGYEQEEGADALDPNALSAELDELDFSGGIDSDSDGIGGGDDLDDLEDDGIDLR